MKLTAEQEGVLQGSDGRADALAMRLIVALARAQGAQRLVAIKSAHIDSCLYHGQAGLDFARRLVELGGRTRVPTTTNVGSVDLIHPALVRQTTEAEAEVARQGRVLMQLYRDLGCQETWTCAPYQLPGRPGLGDHVAWAESNAIVFANSVLGARTQRYGDFVDICASITGWAPYAGLHLSDERRGQVLVECRLDDQTLDSDLTYPLVGYLTGKFAGVRVPVITGLPGDLHEDRLKALGAAAASSGGVALFHVVGRTPEAARLSDAMHPAGPDAILVIAQEDLMSARVALTSGSDSLLKAVSIGTPHASVDECAVLARLLPPGTRIHPNVEFFLSTNRHQAEELSELGLLDQLEDAGVRLILDTCSYVTSILSPGPGTVMTNSGKWAHYAPGNIGVDVVLASLEECVRSALSGCVQLAQGKAT